MPRFFQIDMGSDEEPPERRRRARPQRKPEAPAPEPEPGEEGEGGGSRPLLWILAAGLVVALLVFGVWLGARLGGGAATTGEGGGSTGADPGAVMATVNGQALTNRMIEVELEVQRVLQAQTGRVMQDDATALQSFRREILSQVIDQILLLQAATAAGVAVTDAEANAELPMMLGQYGLDGPTLAARVQAAGITPAEFAEWARRQVANGRYVQSPAAQQLAGGFAAPEQVASILQQTADIVLTMPDGSQVRPAQEGQMAPDFELQTADGETIKLSDLRGKPVMINFWATWCGPCQVEMPLFVDAYNKNKDQLVVLGVDVQEPAEPVRQFMQRFGMTFPVPLDLDGQVSTLYRVRALPTTYFIDAEGRIVRAHRGAILNRPQLQPFLDEIMTEGG